MFKSDIWDHRETPAPTQIMAVMAQVSDIHYDRLWMQHSKRAKPWSYNDYMGEFPLGKHPFSANPAFQMELEQELKNMNVMRQNSMGYIQFFNLH